MSRPKNPEKSIIDLTPSLVLRLRDGASEAGKILDKLYRPSLKRFCQGYLGRTDEVEDVVQDVFCRVLSSETIPDKFRAWIYRIARNRCLDILRGRARRPNDETLLTNIHLESVLTGNLTRLVRNEQRSRLRHLLAALPPDQCEVLSLRYTEGLSRAEIANVLEIPESLVKSRLFEGLEKLRRYDSFLNGR